MYMQKTLIVTFFLLKIVDKEKNTNIKKQLCYNLKKYNIYINILTEFFGIKNQIHYIGKNVSLMNNMDSYTDNTFRW